MEKNKASICHEALNLLTKVNIIIGGSKMDRHDKNELQKIIKIVGLLISNEDVILGAEVKFLNEEFDFNEILDFVIAINEDILRESKMYLQLPDSDLHVCADKAVVENFIGQIIVHLCLFASSIDFVFDNEAKTLQINYEGKRSLQFAHKTLLSCINDKGCIVNELPIRISMHLMSLNGIKIKFNRKMILITFP